MSPLISIITITYNSERYLQQTINSIANQTYPEIEYIVIDGQSTDKTLDIIKKNSNVITTWLSEKDTGIADAMNKGLKEVSGEYILFLHSDDYLLASDSLVEAIKYLDNRHDIFAFSLYFQKQDLTKSKKTPSWDYRYYLKTKLLHQGVFCRKELFDQIGCFDTRFKIAMDYDFFLRAYYKKCRVKLIPNTILSVMRDTGVSSRNDWESLLERLMEEKKIHFKNSDSIKLNVIYKVYWFMYPKYKKLLSGIKTN